jgi:FtsZ-binding cell division protein ZapB
LEGKLKYAGRRVNENVDSEEELNRSLDDVIGLLQQEIERLKESLETYRLSKHPNRADIIRWHVQTLDERQDAFEELQSLLVAQRDAAEVH